MTIYVRNYLFSGAFCTLKKLMEFPAMLTLRASLDLPHSRRCGPLAVLTYSFASRALRLRQTRLVQYPG
jgi:hypothetical protein